MKPTKTLIEAMLKVADGIENGTLNYNWNAYEDCNCGLIAQELLAREGRDACEMILEAIGAGSPGWAFAAKRDWCPQTNLPLTEVFQLLHKHGLERDDFELIELAGTSIPTPTRRDGLYNYLCRNYAKPGFVARFLRELAEELEERRVSERAQAAETRMTEEPRNSPASGQADATTLAG